MNIDWKQIPFFECLAGRDIGPIEAAVRRHHYGAGATIFEEGDTCAGFYIVVDGLVRIYRTNVEGRLHTLSLLRPLSTFNEVAAVDGGPNPFNAAAVTQVETLVINHDRLMQLLASEPALLSNYVQALAHLNREYIERLEDMTFRSIPSRLAKLFLHEAMRTLRLCGGSPRIGTTGRNQYCPRTAAASVIPSSLLSCLLVNHPCSPDLTCVNHKYSL